MKCCDDVERGGTANRIYMTLTGASFDALAHTAGSTIVAIDNVFINPDNAELLSPALFNKFLVLRSLDCQISAPFDSTEDISPHCLSTLESIRLWACDSSFLDILSRMG